MKMFLAHMTQEASNAIGVAMLLIGMAVLVIGAIIVVVIIKLVKRWKL